MLSKELEEITRKVVEQLEEAEKERLQRELELIRLLRFRSVNNIFTPFGCSKDSFQSMIMTKPV